MKINRCDRERADIAATGIKERAESPQELEPSDTRGRVLAFTSFGGLGLGHNNRVRLAIFLLLMALPGLAQSNGCLRVMPIEELTRQSILIARVKVKRVDKANYRGEFNQLAVLTPVDVIDGDFTLKQLNVLARSSVRCAEDNYVKDEEMLVFLEPQDSLFHTVDYQYGQFTIAGEIVKGWRDKANKPIDKPYAEVRAQILACVAAAHTAKPEEQPKTQPVKPPL